MIDLHLGANAPRWRFLYAVRIDAYALIIVLPRKEDLETIIGSDQVILEFQTQPLVN